MGENFLCSVVSGVNVKIINPITCLVCVFYTCVVSSPARAVLGPHAGQGSVTAVAFQGGLRAVVWTDALQLLSLVLANIVVLAVGVYKIGSLGEVWSRAAEGQRLEMFKSVSMLYAATRCGPGRKAYLCHGKG